MFYPERSVLQCKSKRHHLLTFLVSKHYLLALQGSATESLIVGRPNFIRLRSCLCSVFRKHKIFTQCSVDVGPRLPDIESISEIGGIAPMMVFLATTATKPGRMRGLIMLVHCCDMVAEDGPSINHIPGPFVYHPLSLGDIWVAEAKSGFRLL